MATKIKAFVAIFHLCLGVFLLASELLNFGYRLTPWLNYYHPQQFGLYWGIILIVAGAAYKIGKGWPAFIFPLLPLSYGLIPIIALLTSKPGEPNFAAGLIILFSLGFIAFAIVEAICLWLLERSLKRKLT